MVFEIGIYHYSFLSLNQEIGLSSLIFIFAAATLSTLIPSTPGYVGTFHLAIYLSAQIVDIEKDMAAAYSIIIHDVLVIPNNTWIDINYFSTLESD